MPPYSGLNRMLISSRLLEVYPTFEVSRLLSRLKFVKSTVLHLFVNAVLDCKIFENHFTTKNLGMHPLITGVPPLPLGLLSTATRIILIGIRTTATRIAITP
ncbi:hypothetical protein CEXT_133961 [Caerostris extrusa]|uniref:Uncharacterized protein n=1 Tax=Caerostris extrusa TaxID=172846 RepID=A0AAV4ME49_CAEEX|nr:hypothetical protein CEXT_133961 [Caerostris extrusa]